MRKVNSKYKDDCAIACFAMVADVPYTKALRLVIPYRKKRGDKGARPNQILKAFFNLNIPSIRRNLPKKNILSIKNTAILVIEENNAILHGVVWDPKHGRILDPSHVRSRGIKFYQRKLQYFLEINK